MLAAILAVTVGGAFALGATLPASFQRLVLLTVAGVGFLSLAPFFTPLGKVERLRDAPSRRFDERDIMFARARLQPDSDRFKVYYAMRPENKSKAQSAPIAAAACPSAPTLIQIRSITTWCAGATRAPQPSAALRFGLMTYSTGSILPGVARLPGCPDTRAYFLYRK